MENVIKKNFASIIMLLLVIQILFTLPVSAASMIGRDIFSGPEVLKLQQQLNYIRANRYSTIPYSTEDGLYGPGATRSVKAFQSLTGLEADGIVGPATSAKITAVINDINKPKEIKVTGITLDKTSASLKSGATLTLSATIQPSNATNKGIKWTSSNSTIATVDTYGKVTGLKAGTAYITATTTDGSYSKTSTITVTSSFTIMAAFSKNPANNGDSVYLTATTSSKASEVFFYFENGADGSKNMTSSDTTKTNWVSLSNKVLYSSTPQSYTVVAIDPNGNRAEAKVTLTVNKPQEKLTITATCTRYTGWDYENFDFKVSTNRPVVSVYAYYNGNSTKYNYTKLNSDGTSWQEINGAYGVVSGIRTVTITAVASDGSTASTSVTLNVYGPNLQPPSSGLKYTNKSAMSSYAYNNALANDGTLCAEFVSNCLSAGGIVIPNKNYTDSQGVTANARTWVPSLFAYFKESGNKIIYNPSKSQIDVGDVLLYDGLGGDLNGNPDHTAIVRAKNSNGNLLLCAHNNNRLDVSYEFFGTPWAVIKIS